MQTQVLAKMPPETPPDPHDPDDRIPNKFVLIDLDSKCSTKAHCFMHTDHTPITKGNAMVKSALGVDADRVELFDTPTGSTIVDAAATLGVLGVGRHLTIVYVPPLGAGLCSCSCTSGGRSCKMGTPKQLQTTQLSWIMNT